MSDSEKRRALVMKSLRNAIDERPGTYIDHVMVTRNWARKTSNDFEFFRLSLRDSTTKRLFLSVKDDSIIPIGMKPIGFRDREYRGLSILEDETKKELGKLSMAQETTYRTEERLSKVKSSPLTHRGDSHAGRTRDHSEIRRLYRELLSSMSPYQAVEELPLITGEKRADIEAKPAKIVGSTRRLIPYILLAEETDRDFKKIKSVTWFKPRRIRLTSSSGKVITFWRTWSARMSSRSVRRGRCVDLGDIRTSQGHRCSEQVQGKAKSWTYRRP